MRKFLSLLLVALLMLTAVFPALAQERPTVTDLLGSGDIGSFTTLLAAAEAAGLVDTLLGEGPFTILAPSDEAFAAALESLGLTPEFVLGQPELLSQVLLYHVIPGRYFFRNLAAGPTLETALAGESVTFDLTDGVFTVNGVGISNPDNLTANGIVHVIDGVLLPSSIMAALGGSAAAEPTAEPTVEPTAEAVVAEAPARPSVVDVLSSGDLGSFTTLLAAAEAAGLVDTLLGEGPFTILAPTDDAFAALLDASALTAEDLLASPELVRDVLLYHVIPGRYFFRNLAAGPTLETAFNRESVTFNLEGGVFTVNGVRISNPDNLVANGIVHVIDGVLATEAQAALLTPSGAKLRVGHFSPDAGAVDVYVDGRLSLEAVEFGTLGEWMDVRPGVYDFAVVPTGTEPSGSFKTNIAEGDWVTLAATGTVAQDSIRLNVLREDMSAVPENRVRISLFHAIEEAGPIDVTINGQLLVGALRYPGTLDGNDGFDIREVGAGTYDVQVLLSGSGVVALDLPNTQFVAGQNYFVAVVGTVGLPSAVVDATLPPTE